MKKMLSICLSHTTYFNSSVSKNSFSTISLKVYAYGEANLVFMVVPETYCLTRGKFKVIFFQYEFSHCK